MIANQSSSTGLNLTQATQMARILVKYGSIFLVILIVGKVFLGSLIAFWKAVNPPLPPPPTVGFGRLPIIGFPEQNNEDKPSAYSLETATGSTPNFGDRVKVLLMLKSTPNLLADSRAREIAAIYDFVFEPEIITSQIYRWRKAQPLETKLEMNIFNQHFTLVGDYSSRPDLLVDKKLPDDFEAVQRVKSFLQSANLLPSDVATAAGEIAYMKSIGGKLQTAVSLSDADFIQVDINRTPIDSQFKMFGAEGNQGSIHAIVSGFFNGKNSIVQLMYRYQPIDYQQVETYPLRASQQAWKVLQAGEGYIANKGKLDQAVIRNISLGYYESDFEQDYLQPIYVFEGDDDFLGYVSAVDPKFTQSNQ